jgi:hypothetical protein
MAASRLRAILRVALVAAGVVGIAALVLAWASPIGAEARFVSKPSKAYAP